jgi:C4-dicarboxylate transporter, DctM subunit
MITPPVGMNVYVIHGITKVPMPTIFKGIGPFLATDVAHVALLIAIPEISTFLPSLI